MYIDTYKQRKVLHPGEGMKESLTTKLPQNRLEAAGGKNYWVKKSQTFLSKMMEMLWVKKGLTSSKKCQSLNTQKCHFLLFKVCFCPL